MSISLIQTATGSSINNTAAITLGLSSQNTLAGDMVLVACTEDKSSDVITNVTATGMAFNKITAASGLTADATTYLAIFYAFNVTGATTPVISINKTSTVSGEAVAFHYRGVAKTNPLDKTVTSTGTSTALVSGLSPPLSQANELIVGIGSSDFGGATYTVGAGYSHLTQITANGNSECGMQDKTVTSIAAVSTAFTSNESASWRCSLLTFLQQSNTTNLLLTTGF